MLLAFVFAITIAVGSIGTILIKIGTNKIPAIGFSMESIWQIATNIYILLGIALYAASFPLYSYILQKLNVNIAYPVFTSLSFAAVIILSSLFLKEGLTFFQIIGLLLVVGGVALLALNGAK